MALTAHHGRFDTLSASGVDIFLSIISGLMVASAFPAYSWHYLAWIALIPLFFIIIRSGYVKTGLLCSLAGVLFYGTYMWWTSSLEEATPSNFILFICFLALPFPLFGLLAKVAQNRFPGWEALSYPIIWVSLDYIKTHVGFLSFQHGILGYSQYKLLPVAGIAEFTGIHGVTFVIVAVNASLASLLWNYFKTDSAQGIYFRRCINPSFGMLGIVTAVVAAATIASSTARESKTGVRYLDAALIQGNAVVDKKTDREKYIKEVFPSYLNLTTQAARAGSRMIVWPSSTVPGVIPTDRKMTAILARLAKNEGIFLLVGAAGYDKFNAEQAKARRVANSSFLFSPTGGMLGRYDKIHLLPFDEYVPLREYITWPSWIVPPQTQDHFPGKKLTMFQAGENRFGVQICFENMFPEQIRKLVSDGANFIVGQTNELYIKGSPAAQYQNLSFYVMRAIENQVPVIRSSTNGVSCFIGSDGKIISSVRDSSGNELNTIGSTSAKIPIRLQRTFYNRHGDILPVAALIFSVFMGVFGVMRNKGTVVQV
jgi:apolipoprotein N-acyltransferase